MSMIDSFEHRVWSVIDDFIEILNLDYSIKDNIKIDYNVKGKTAGIASFNIPDNIYTLKFNRDAILNNYDYMLNETIPHEVAHLAQWIKPNTRIKNHNKAWKRLCIMLGGKGNTYHKMSLKGERKTKKYIYEVKGFKFEIGAIRHRKILNGLSYRITIDGEKIPFSYRNYTGEYVVN